jgi:hypothetical protein
MLPFLRSVAATCVCLLCLGSSAVVQSPPCDPALPRNDRETTGYRQRSDRCEGIYKRDVASFGVQLVSFAAVPRIEDICVPGQPVHLIWARAQTSSGTPIHVQVESLRRQLYYRMDTDRPPQSTSYEWPTEPRCSSEVRLRTPELAVLARTQSSVGPKPVDVLLPVNFSTSLSADVRPPYRAVLLPGRRVAEVYVSLWHYRSAQNPARVWLEKPLGMRPYPAGVQIVVEVSPQELKERGLYRIRLSVEFESGEQEALDFFFFDAD